MSVNDPILEALSFTLENALEIASSSTSAGAVTTTTTPVLRIQENCPTPTTVTTTDGGVVEGAEPASSKGAPSADPNSTVHLFGELERTTCPFQNCGYSTAGENVSKSKTAQGEVLAHLLEQHKLVIDSPDEIANLSRYLSYWRDKFEGGRISDFCVGFAMEEPPKPVVSRRNSKKAMQVQAAESPPLVAGESDDKSDVKPTESSSSGDNLYYMLTPALPEDSQLRKDLWKQRLDFVLEVNRQEREDTSFCRRCLFCRDVVTGNRSTYFLHMRDSHSFHIGLPDNLVFVKELLQLIEDKLNRLECLFCENIFKDKAVLKEHMRKKQHRQLNPKNHEYDKFYVVNYLEPGKTWETIELEDTEDERKEDEWVEPTEEKERSVVCLFCAVAECEFPKILDHIKADHSFDFIKITSGLDFYQKVKLVNYIRRTVYQNICLVCEAGFEERAPLLEHISKHNIQDRFEALPSSEKWNQPEYFFPTYESDGFLTFLDSTPTIPDSGDSEDESNVIPEDFPHIDINREFDLAGFAIRYHNQNR